MAILEFNATEIIALITHARASRRYMTTPDALAGAPAPGTPALIFVVGAGVFRMSNGMSTSCVPDLTALDLTAPDKRRPRAYARSCNPNHDRGWLTRTGMIMSAQSCHQRLEIDDIAGPVLRLGDSLVMLSVSADGIAIYDPPTLWEPGDQAFIGSGIEEVLHVKIVKTTRTHAVVRNIGNGEALDGYPPYDVPLDALRPPLIEPFGAVSARASRSGRDDNMAEAV